MIFAPAPWFRILFLAIAAFIIIGIFTIASDESSEGGFLVPIIIAAVCIIAALYEESWIFNRKEEIVTSKSGLFYIHKTRTYSFKNIANLELVVFLRGRESDSAAEHEIKLGNPFSKENTAEAADRGPRIIHKKYHLELRLNLQTGEHRTIESLDGRSGESLKKKAVALAEFNGFRLVE